MLDWSSLWKWMRRVRVRYYGRQHKGAKIAHGTCWEQWQSWLYKCWNTHTCTRAHAHMGSGYIGCIAGGVTSAGVMEIHYLHDCSSHAPQMHTHTHTFAHIHTYKQSDTGCCERQYLELCVFNWEVALCRTRGCIYHYLLQQLLPQLCLWHCISHELPRLQQYLPKIWQGQRTREVRKDESRSSYNIHTQDEVWKVQNLVN